MLHPVSTKDPAAVEAEVQTRHQRLFPQGDALFVPRVFGWAVECFTGRYPGYQAVDARYHDFEHTLQGTLCLARLLAGRQEAGAQPVLSERAFQLAIAAVLLHDTGYLKRQDDRQGTGAKYTVTHVDRSAEFAAALLAEKGFGPAEIDAVRNMIRCTGINASLGAIPFSNEAERIGGLALATADLLGQMAAEDYLPKLPILYEEFAEAARFSGDRHQFVAGFASADDLIRRTPDFWDHFVRPRLDAALLGLHQFLRDPYPAGPNWYLDRIEASIRRLRRRLEAGMDPISAASAGTVSAPEPPR